jgi:hypothetical protein
MRKESAMGTSIGYSERSGAIGQLVEDLQTDPSVRTVFETGTLEHKTELLEERYSLGRQDLYDIYLELKGILPARGFWFWDEAEDPTLASLLGPEF